MDMLNTSLALGVDGVVLTLFCCGNAFPEKTERIYCYHKQIYIYVHVRMYVDAYVYKYIQCTFIITFQHKIVVFA